MGTSSFIDDKEISWKRKEERILLKRTGVDNGAPPFAEVSTRGYEALEMEQGDIIFQMVPLPKDVDPTKPIGITARCSSGSTTTTDVLLLALLYEVVASGGAMFPTTVNDAPETDFPTKSPTSTAFSEIKTRAIIAADTFTSQQIADGAYLAIKITATTIQCDTNAGGEGFFIMELILDYVPKRCLGEALVRDVGL